MQQHIGESEEELRRTKEQLYETKKERDRAIDELRETKKIFAEVKSLKGELTMKERNIESLKVELDKANQSLLKLAERESAIDRLNEELRNVKASEARSKGLLTKSTNIILDLESEIERGKLSESKMYDSVVSQSKQLEETKRQLEESKQEIASVRDQMEKLKTQSSYNNENNNSMKQELENLKSELQLAKDNMARAQDGEEVAISKAKRLVKEMEMLENEIKLVTNAEETSKKAMDELASALKEVATEMNNGKEKLISTQLELEHVQEEAEQLKEMVRTTEERYKKLLDEAERENELHKNTADRLRLEADDSVLAWNEKVMGFVDCIKRSEQEKSLAQDENMRLTESVRVAEDTTRLAKEESYKLRDILKQALNEANAAKAAASIASDENYQLKDFLAEKDDALHFLTRENERLRIDEAEAHENIKGLKKLLSSSTELKSEGKDKERGGILKKPPNPVIQNHQEESKSRKTFSFDLNELFLNKRDDVNDKGVDTDPEVAEALKGSIFDTVDSPKSEPVKPKSRFHQRRGSTFTIRDDAEMPNSEDFDHLEGLHFDGADSDKQSHRRKGSAMLRRFGDLIMKKSSHNHKKELST